MRRAIALALLLTLVGCETLVRGESGTVTAINFVPSNAPNAFEAYIDVDEADTTLKIQFGCRPDFKVGDHVAVYYEQSGAMSDVRKEKIPIHKL